MNEGLSNLTCTYMKQEGQGSKWDCRTGTGSECKSVDVMLAFQNIGHYGGPDDNAYKKISRDHSFKSICAKKKSSIIK